MEILPVSSKKGESIIIDDKSLLVFIDETGVESLNDPNFPLFGLGCILIPSIHYSKVIDEPWKIFRKEIANDSEKSLHAAEFTKYNNFKLHVSKVSSFFSDSIFKRMAIIISDKTSFDSNNYNCYQIIASLLSEKITVVTQQNQHLKSIALIFENSDNGNKNLIKYFRDIDFKNHGVEIPINLFVAKKDTVTGLDVADFVAHAAGTQTRNRLEGKTNYRKDFESVFKKCNQEHSYFLEITNVSSAI